MNERLNPYELGTLGSGGCHDWACGALGGYHCDCGAEPDKGKYLAIDDIIELIRSDKDTISLAAVKAIRSWVSPFNCPDLGMKQYILSNAQRLAKLARNKAEKLGDMELAQALQAEVLGNRRELAKLNQLVKTKI